MKNYIILILIILFILLIVLLILRKKGNKNKTKFKDKKELFNLKEYSVEEFFAFRKSYLKRFRNVRISGVYILYNRNKNIYYVGQGSNVINRINMHFVGHGNGDIYADYVNKDIFDIKFIFLDESGYSSLDELERMYIRAYNAKEIGYNKTRGNYGKKSK